MYADERVVDVDPLHPLLTAAGICVMMETYIEAWQLFMHDARGRLFNMHMHRAALFDLTLHYQRTLYIHKDYKVCV